MLLPYPTPADHLAQKTLLRLWLARKDYQPSGDFAAYVFQIGRHLYLNQRLRQKNRKRREVTIDELSQQIALAFPRLQPEDAMMKDLEARYRRHAIASLPEIYRAVLVLSHFENRKYAEIAQHLNIPVGTVKSRMAEAVRRLRRALTPEGRL